MLYTKNLAVGYGKKILIDNINIEVMGGEILCLLGPNGSGKSTILKSISQQLETLGGVVSIKDRVVGKLNSSALAKEMSVVLTQRISPDMMTCYELVSLGRYPFTDSVGRLNENDKAIIKNSLELVGWWENRERFFSDLSDGERQRVLLARAICQTPKVIVLDEPTSYLDIKHKIALLTILRQLAATQNIAVVLSLHEVDLAAKTADRLVLIKNNSIIGYGCPEDILNDDVIGELYSIEQGNFSLAMGSIELPAPKGEANVFVMGGAGNGSPIYRLLQRNGMAFATGILWENDIDYLSAKNISSYIISFPSYTHLSKDVYLNAIEIMKNYRYIIDSGTDCLDYAQYNIDLLRWACQNDKQVISLRKHPLDIEGITYCNTVGELISHIKNL